MQGYLVAFCIGIFLGFRVVPEFIGVLYVMLAVVCLFLAFQNNIRALFSLLPFMIYAEMYMRVWVHSLPYLFMPYFYIAVFSVLILKGGPGVRLHSRSFILLLLFIVIEFINSTRSINADVTRGLLTNSLALAIIVTWASSNIISPVLANTILNSVKYATVFLIGIIIVRYLVGNVEFEAAHSGSEGTNGLAPVQLSGYLGFSCTVFFFSIMNDQERKNLLMNIVWLFCSAILMILTFSRGGIYFLGIMMIMYFLFHRTELKSYFLFVLLIPAAMLIYYYVSEKTNGLIEDRYEQAGSSGRDLLVEAGWSLFKEQPLAGVGPGNFGAEITKNNLYQVESGAHNEFIRIGAEDGLLGIITYWGFFIVTFFQILRRHKIQREYGIYFLLFFCLVVIHNGLKISLQPLLLMLAVATPSLVYPVKKIKYVPGSQKLAI